MTLPTLVLSRKRRPKPNEFVARIYIRFAAVSRVFCGVSRLFRGSHAYCFTSFAAVSRCLASVSRLSRGCLMAVSRLSHGCLAAVSRLSRGCLAAVSQLSLPARTARPSATRVIDFREEARAAMQCSKCSKIGQEDPPGAAKTVRSLRKRVGESCNGPLSVKKGWCCCEEVASEHVRWHAAPALRPSLASVSSHGSF